MTTSIDLMDVESERAVLGSMMRSPAQLSHALDSLHADDFSQHKHKTIFRTIKEMVGEGKEIDSLTVAKRLHAAGLLKGVGGEGAVATMADNVPNVNHARQYVKNVKDRSIRRAIQERTNMVLHELHIQPDIDEMIEYAEKHIFSVRDRFKGLGSQSETSEDLAASFTEFLKTNGEGTVKWPLPARKLQEKTGGLEQGDCIVVGALPGDGKSLWAQQIVECVCRAGAKAAIHNLEMTGFAMERRFVAQAGVPFKHLKNPELLTDSERKLAAERIDELRKMDYTIYSGTATVENMVARQQRDPADVVIVDHLHRMSTDMAQIEKNIAGLRNMALDTGCVVIVLAQVSRVDGGEMPPINKLRGSGMIEAEATGVFMLWRERDEDGNRLANGNTRLYVAKMRDDEADYPVNLHFDRKTLTFQDREQGYQHPVVEGAEGEV